MKKALIPQVPYAVVERTLTNKKGEVFRVYFAVTSVNGVPHFRVIRAEKVEKLAGETVPTQSFILPTVSDKQTIGTSISFNTYVSPYFSLLELFFTSQMTRAPARSF